MGFQTSVNLMPARGLPGVEVNVGQAIYTAQNYVSDGTAEAGTFAFAPALAAQQDEGIAVGKAGKTGTRLLGFVERNQSSVFTTVTTEATNVYLEGIGLNIAIRGQFYMNAPANATNGQAVLCDPATGAITFGNVGATNDTGWVVVIPEGMANAVSGDLIIIQNFG